MYSNSNYVFTGQEYRAQIFLAAYDSTNVPEVELENGTMLETESGKGIYQCYLQQHRCTEMGRDHIHRTGWPGDQQDFTAEFEVAQATATISATGMNVFYRGIPNPVAISAGGVTESAVQARISSGNIRRTGAGEYVGKTWMSGRQRPQ